MVREKDNLSPRIIVIQKVYGYTMNPDQEITFSKNQYKAFIKDVVNGTIERFELIEDLIEKHLKEDIDFKKTDVILKIILFCAIYEFLYKHNNPKKVIISEYLKASEFFLELSQIKYLNAILDKISKLFAK